jgi:hypothetical protein
MYLILFIDIVKLILPYIWAGLFSFCLYVLIKKLYFFYTCYKQKTLKAYFFNWIFNSQNVKLIIPLGITLPNYFFIRLLSKYMNSTIGWGIILTLFYGIGLYSGIVLWMGVGYYFMYIAFFRIYIWPVIKYKLYPFKTKFYNKIF